MDEDTSYLRRRKFLRRFVFPLFIVIFFVSLVELASFIHVKRRGYEPDPFARNAHLYNQYRIHELNPRYRTRPGYGHSREGFRRDDPVSPENVDGVFRIFLMGGSTTYGLGAFPPYELHPGLKNEEGIDRAIEDALNGMIEEKGISKRVEVINAAAVNYNTYQHLVYIMEKLYLYKPDMIVFLDGANDFYYFMRDYDHLKDYWYSYAYVSDWLNERSWLFPAYAGARVLARYSYAFTLVEMRLEYCMNCRVSDEYERNLDRCLTAADVKEQYPDIAHNSFLRAYRLIQALSMHYDFGMFVFLQPYIPLENSALLGEADRENREITVRELKSANWDPESFNEIRKTFPVLFAKYGIPFHDLGQIADETTGDSQLYIDYCHLAPAGAKRVGTLMAEMLAPLVLAEIKNR